MSHASSPSRPVRRRRRLARHASLWLLGISAAMLVLLYNLMRTEEVDLHRLAVRALGLSASSIDPAAERQLVAVTGLLIAGGKLGDPGLLPPGDYVEIWRNVEIYAWHEEQLDQGAVRYEPRWSSDPPVTSEMRRPEGHENPVVSLRSDVLSLPEAWVGAYRFFPRSVQMLAAEPLEITPDLVVDPRHRLAQGRIYIGAGTPEQPHLGDVRVSYKVVRAGRTVTLLGEQRDGAVIPYYSDGVRAYHLLPGPSDAAIAQLPRLIGNKPEILSLR